LVDDEACCRLLPGLRRWAPAARSTISPWRRWSTIVFAAATVPVSATMLASGMGLGLPWTEAVAPVAELIAPLRSVNGYGLFAVMTTTRPEIVIEGSNDGENWKAYEFTYKPGDVRRRPPWVAPHQPRVDWQMWFAALGEYPTETWLHALCQRLLEGSPSV